MHALILKEKSLISTVVSQRLAKKLILALVLVIVFEFFLFPAPVLASEYSESDNFEDSATLVHNTVDLSFENEFINNLPNSNELTIIRESYHTLSAYNSEVAQCDSTPCITANGFNLCEHGVEDSIAANFLKFGTKVRIPELFGDRIFVVRDRMNSRYIDRVDIWMLEKTDAKQFGIKIAKIEVLGAP